MERHDTTNIGSEVDRWRPVQYSAEIAKTGEEIVHICLFCKTQMEQTSPHYNKAICRACENEIWHDSVERFNSNMTKEAPQDYRQKVNYLSTAILIEIEDKIYEIFKRRRY